MTVRPQPMVLETTETMADVAMAILVATPVVLVGTLFAARSRYVTLLRRGQGAWPSVPVRVEHRGAGAYRSAAVVTEYRSRVPWRLRIVAASSLVVAALCPLLLLDVLVRAHLRSLPWLLSDAVDCVLLTSLWACGSDVAEGADRAIPRIQLLAAVSFFSSLLFPYANYRVGDFTGWDFRALAPLPSLPSLVLGVHASLVLVLLRRPFPVPRRDLPPRLLRPLMVLAVPLFALTAFVGWPRYSCPSRVGISTTSARALLSSAETWRSERADDACPTPAILLADHALDAASKVSDAWDNAYQIACLADDTIVASAGPDRVFGTSDDIHVPSMR